jgi:restriction system protein
MPLSKIPTYDSMINPLLEALRSLGGSGTIEEIDGKVAEIMNLSDEQLEVLQDPDKGSRTKFEYRLAWTRTYLKSYGLLENSSRGVWALTSVGRKTERVDEKEVVKTVREKQKEERTSEHIETGGDNEPEITETWRDQVLNKLLELEPSAFERLIQRLLRESGFVQVQVTGKSGDGGIDGKGIMKLGGLLGFHVIFQCKRYRGSVSPSQIRDFRGAMVGKADKGLFVTTGSFTKDAIKEASRDGASPIDLIDGDLLVDKLKEFGLGISTKIIEVEKISIDPDWFESL